MALEVQEYSTGACVLPDIGQLQYNGIEFSSLYTSTLSGKQIQDDAGRTVKGVEYSLSVEGVVTLNTGEDTTDAAWVRLRRQLSVDAGILYYERKGFGSVLVNAPGGVKDMAWGPKPKVLEFRPLGGSRAALIRWEVTYMVPELASIPNPLPVVQFNSEISISYDDEGFTKLSIHGVLEIPMTRLSVGDRTVPTSVDAYREKYMDAVAASFDLTRFRITNRHFRISRDRRTMDWEFTAEELPYMGLPLGATSARGTFSVRTEKNNPALFPWICSMRCTYTIQIGASRRLAWMHFISLLRYRMQCSTFGVVPSTRSPASAPHESIPASITSLAGTLASPFFLGPFATAGILKDIARSILGAEKRTFATKKDDRACIPLSFEIDEGLYLDSRKITFGATWKLICSFSTLLFAAGIWKYPGGPEHGMESRTLWATSVRKIMGSRSWLANSVIGDADVIVDMGSK